MEMKELVTEGQINIAIAMEKCLFYNLSLLDVICYCKRTYNVVFKVLF